MPLPVHQDGFDKFRRYRMTRKARGRMTRKAKGQKLLRLWVLDPRSPIFCSEARRQAALLQSAPEEDEALAFIAAAADFGDDRR